MIRQELFHCGSHNNSHFLQAVLYTHDYLLHDGRLTKHNAGQHGVSAIGKSSTLVSLPLLTGNLSAHGRQTSQRDAYAAPREQPDPAFHMGLNKQGEGSLGGDLPFAT